jgi:hypothetical protein
MVNTFYVVQRGGVPAIWQAHPEQLPALLNKKTDFKLVSDVPVQTRQDALLKLRQLFPGSRPVKRKVG